MMLEHCIVLEFQNYNAYLIFILLTDTNHKEVGSASDDQFVLQHHKDVAGESLQCYDRSLCSHLPHLHYQESCHGRP